MVNPIDNLRSELQRPGEAWIELLQREFKALRKGIVSDIVTELRHSTRKTPRHRTDPHKEAIARLIQEDPEIRNLQICRQMDKLQEKSSDYSPPRSWPSRFWVESYRQVGNRVHSYLGSIRRGLR